jgi:hypothetical protein
MAVVVFDPIEKHWECPSCHIQYVTHEPRPHIPMHFCVALNGLCAPYAEIYGDDQHLKKNSVRHVAVEREDYIGTAIPRTDDNGKPFSAVLTERADGSNDCHAFADTATAILN